MRFDPLDPSTWQAPLPRRRRQPSRPSRPPRAPRPRFPRTTRAVRELSCALESARSALRALEEADGACAQAGPAAWDDHVAAWEHALQEAVWHAADAVVSLHTAMARGEPRQMPRATSQPPSTAEPTERDGG